MAHFLRLSSYPMVLYNNILIVYLIISFKGWRLNRIAVANLPSAWEVVGLIPTTCKCLCDERNSPVSTASSAFYSLIKWKIGYTVWRVYGSTSMLLMDLDHNLWPIILIILIINYINQYSDYQSIMLGLNYVNYLPPTFHSYVLFRKLNILSLMGKENMVKRSQEIVHFDTSVKRRYNVQCHFFTCSKAELARVNNTIGWVKITIRAEMPVFYLSLLLKDIIERGLIFFVWKLA